jgi:subtilisin family serine protease
MKNSRLSVLTTNTPSSELRAASAASEAENQWSVVNESARLLSAVILSLTLTGVLRGAPANSVPDRLLVKPRDGIDESALQNLFAAHGAQQHAAIHQINVRILHVPEAARDHVLDALQHNSKIEFAELDQLKEPFVVPNDPYYGSQWHLSKIQCAQAWDFTTGKPEVVIAVVDTGIAFTHSDLAGKILPGYDFGSNDGDPTDVGAHGTAVAGTAAALSNNGTGVTGVAWGNRILPVKVFDSSGYASDSNIAKGIMYAADQGARVINLSLGGPGASSTLQNAIDYAWNRNAVVVAAAGNYGDSIAVYPAACHNVVAVGSVDSSDTRSTFSSYGSWLTLSAPGEIIFTTQNSSTSLYVAASGTSFASPIVAGVVALMASANTQLSNAQIVDLLKQSTDDLGTTGFDIYYGFGRVNAYKAVRAASGSASTDTTPPTAAISSPLAGSTVAGTVTIGVNASDNVGVTKVECYINDVLASTSASGSFSWNTTAYSNGSYTLRAKAYDAAGNIGTSAITTVSVQNSLADTTAPRATLTGPTAGSTVSGVVPVSVSATDNVAVTKVEWYLNGVMAGSSASATATFSWNTANTPNGTCNLLARAYDAAGNVGSSTTVSVSVQNVADTTAPTVRITSPTSGATLARSAKVYVTAGDNVAVTRVDLLLDEKLYSTSSSATPVFSMNTGKISRGSHTLKSVAYDAAGNSTPSAVVTVYK